MGELTDLMEKLKNDPCIPKVRFSPAFLEDVGNVLEQRGFDEARLFLWEHREREDLGRQIETLLRILDEMEKLRAFEEDRSKAKYIIKNKLNLLLK